MAIIFTSNVYACYEKEFEGFSFKKEPISKFQHEGKECLPVIETMGRQELLSIFSWPRQNMGSYCLNSALYRGTYGLSTIEQAD